MWYHHLLSASPRTDSDTIPLVSVHYLTSNHPAPLILVNFHINIFGLNMSCVSCTNALWFLHGRDVPLWFSDKNWYLNNNIHITWISCVVNVIITNLCLKKDNGLLEIDFVCLTSDSLTTNILLKPLHVDILQLNV